MKAPPNLAADGASLANAIELAGRLVSAKLGELLNKKHLYQSVSVETGELTKAFKQELNGEFLVDQALGRLLNQCWLPRSEAQGVTEKALRFEFPAVRSFCSRCDDSNPFNLTRAATVSTVHITLPPQAGAFQVFCFPLQCQGCKREPVLFMVNRRELKLTLTGRSEFEEVKAPGYVPKDQRKYYSQAVIAYNCGQVLAGLFLLRTLIEQYMRSIVRGTNLRGDELTRKYNEKLPTDFKSRFPSLPESYSELSDAIHRADENRALFDKQLDLVSKHLESKSVYDRNRVRHRSAR